MIVSRDNRDVGRRTSPDYLEGPWMIKRKGKYVLFTAAPYRKPKSAPQTSAPADLAAGYWVYVPAQYDGKTPACVMVFQDGSNDLDNKYGNWWLANQEIGGAEVQRV